MDGEVGKLTEKAQELEAELEDKTKQLLDKKAKESKLTNKIEII